MANHMAKYGWLMDFMVIPSLRIPSNGHVMSPMNGLMTDPKDGEKSDSTFDHGTRGATL